MSSYMGENPPMESGNSVSLRYDSGDCDIACSARFGQEFRPPRHITTILVAAESTGVGVASHWPHSEVGRREQSSGGRSGCTLLSQRSSAPDAGSLDAPAPESIFAPDDEAHANIQHDQKRQGQRMRMGKTV